MKFAIILAIFFFAGTQGREVRISGGSNTPQYEARFMLSLQENGKHICGAVVISESWALTSAQCIIHADVRSLLIRSGSTNKDRGGTIHYIQNIIPHGSYNPETKDYDFALIQVSIPFSFVGGQVSSVSLVSCRTEPAAGKSGKIYGWGSKLEGAAYSPNLQTGKITIVARRFCKTLSDANANAIYYPTMICASSTESDICHGDMGGPLMVDGRLAGIASSEYSCGTDDLPGAYGNVGNENVRLWIANVARV